MNRAQGNIAAKVALIEHSDFECPFCGRYAVSAYQNIQRQFVETGKVKYIFRHLPIDQLHPFARKASEAAECAGDQGKFWEFHDQLFANQKALSLADLGNHARALNLSEIEFGECLRSGKVAKRVADDVAEAKRLGLTGTPVFLLGEIQNDGSVRVTHKVLGAQPYQVFETALNELLASVDSKRN